MPLDILAIVAHGWRQGSLFTVEATGRLIGERAQPNSRLILASQDCDIQHRGNGEPYIDVFQANPIRSISSTESKARNARQLHLAINVDGAAQPHQIKFWSREAVSRECLVEHAPDPHANLEPAMLRWFQQWLGSRYDRPALPDAFNNRLEQHHARREIRAILLPAEDCFGSVYLSIDPFDEELPAEINYTIRVVLIMSEIDAYSEEKVPRAQEARRRLDEFLRACPGIDVQSIEIISDHEFTLADLNLYRPWDYTDLSLTDA